MLYFQYSFGPAPLIFINVSSSPNKPFHIFEMFEAVIVVISCMKYNASFLSLKTHLGCMVSHKANVITHIGKYTKYEINQMHTIRLNSKLLASSHLHRS